MDKIDLGDKLPLGFCSECLDRMVQGAPYGRIKLANGSAILHAYCEHRQAGASLTLPIEHRSRPVVSKPR